MGSAKKRPAPRPEGEEGEGSRRRAGADSANGDRCVAESLDYGKARTRKLERLAGLQHDVGAPLLGKPDAAFVRVHDTAGAFAHGIRLTACEPDSHASPRSWACSTGRTSGQAHSTPSATSP